MIAAGMTFFHGEFSSVSAKLQTLSNHVKHVIIFANSHRDAFDEFAQDLHWLTVLGTGENVGLSVALNGIWQEAREQRCSSVLLLDQDTELCQGFLEALPVLSEYLGAGNTVAAVYPRLLAPEGYKSPQMFTVGPAATKDALQNVWFAPVSGGLYKISVLEEYPFSEQLFIDLIDVEWGLRVNANGLVLSLDPSVELLHTVGTGTLGWHCFRIPLQSDWRYISYIRSTFFVATRQDVRLAWRFKLLAQSIRIVATRLLFRSGRLHFISALMQNHTVSKFSAGVHQ